MRILVTGARGFVGKNLIVRLKELKRYDVLEFHRENPESELPNLVSQVDFIFHLAGVNRPKNEMEFKTGNLDLTKALSEAVIKSGRKIPILYTSSIQAERSNPYGESKREAEDLLLSIKDKVPVFIYRLPNVFGKWSRPNYNSVVATFCNNIAQDLPVTIHDPDAMVNLVYIDDVVTNFIQNLEGKLSCETYQSVEPVYEITVGTLFNKIKSFKESRRSLVTEPVGHGIDRALHATYLSFLRPEQFAYTVPIYGDQRGVFVEMLKTKDSGQFSFFTAHPGITRGGHYHHSKTEKFLVLRGKARYRFRNIVTEEYFQLDVDAQDARVVETIPGWSHDITNIGNEEMVVMLWANEIFDREKPDTVAYGV